MRRRSFKVKEKHKTFHYEVPFEFNGFYEEDELYDSIFNKIVDFAKDKDFSSFKAGFSWPNEIDEAQRFHLKYSMQHKMNHALAEKLKREVDFDSPMAIFLIDFSLKKILFHLNSAYVRGNYCKYSRKIAQTEYFCNKCMGNGCWYCKNTGHFSNDSVEQMLGKYFMEFFKSKDVILHGAGREDMDVLMLGEGRPFIMELISPEKRKPDLKSLEEEINSKLKGKVSVNSLVFSSLEEVAPLKDSLHDKIYHAVVLVPQGINEIDLNLLPKKGDKINVVQKTPTRVEKRRANLNREKKVSILETKLLDKTLFFLEMRTSHGTYVKEFISGDGEKTKPSISSLIKKACVCEQLDVMEICN